MSDRLFLRLPEDALHGPEAGPLPGDSLRAYAATPALRRHVHALLRYRETLAPGTEVLERVVPDGSLRLVVNLGDAPSTHDGPGLVAGVIGASAAPALVRLQGRMHAYSVTLAPGAAQALLGMPAGELTHGAATLSALWGREGELLPERLAEARDDRARARTLQQWLMGRLRDGRADDAGAQQAMHALRLLAAADGRLPLREIAARVGCGERRLQQLFHAHVGLPPRTARRLLRLQACLRRLRRRHAPPEWAEFAVDCGYYDQAHLANEFQSLCGLTPTDYWRSAIVAGSSKTPR